MYGLIGQIITHPNQRPTLTALLTAATVNMPNCLHYLIAHDQNDPNALWITEIWTDKAAHQASLQLPAIQKAMTDGRPLIASFGQRIETIPQNH
ncbi:MAG TPA: antibiotic biosynthesis monooxygenase family protein [Anaerolineae bacterium]|nr:antibiotic biosynthesis monooxygenase family protein [Anaerolineae bacterium]